MDEESEKRTSDEAAYFAQLFSPHTDQDQTREFIMINTFYNMCINILVAEWIKNESNDPEASIGQLIGTWKKSMNEIAESAIQRHTDMMQTNLGKVMGAMVGDGEDMRIKHKKQVDNVEEKIRTALLTIINHNSD